MNTTKIVPVAGLLCLAWAMPLSAQTSREVLIGEARAEFSDSVALGLYLSAMDPRLGAPDSLWAVAGFDFADILLRTDQDSRASVWLRWLARHGARWPIDREWYRPALVDEYNLAVGAVGAAEDSDSASVRTSWRWPGEYDGTLDGILEATASDPGWPVRLAVEGGEPAEASGSLRLPPGTYTVEVSAEGHEPAHVVREVLPGITTVLDVDLASLLPPEVLDGVAERMVRISHTLGGQQVCNSGFLAGPNGLVLTALGVAEGRQPLSVATFDNQELFENVPVVVTDSVRGLALLKLGTDRGGTLPTTSRASSGQYAWSVHFPGCAELTSVRTKLGDWQDPPTSSSQPILSIPDAALGGALIDRDGSLLGLVTGPTTVVPLALTHDVIAQATQSSADREEQDIASQISPGGKFPWKWVGIGAAAVGAGIAASQLGGGGGGGGTNNPPQPTTGGIIITFPSGG